MKGAVLMVWAVKVVDDRGVQHELQGRVVRIINAVIAHRAALSLADHGVIRVSWSDSQTRVVVETHFGAEPDSEQPAAAPAVLPKPTLPTPSEGIKTGRSPGSTQGQSR